MNRNLVLAAVVTGILCGVWAGVAPLVNLSIWAGFAGTTAYFASGKSGAKGLFLTIATTFVGVGTALGMIAGSDLIPELNLRHSHTAAKSAWQLVMMNTLTF